MTTITIYENSGCTYKLDEYHSQVSIEYSDDDLNDGEDWWIPFIDDAEEKYGDQWNCVVATSDDEEIGITFSRSDYFDDAETKQTTSFIPRLFMFGDEFWENMQYTFVNHIYQELGIEHFEYDKFYFVNRDEYFIKTIQNVFNLKNEKYKTVTIVMNPDERSISAMALVGHFSQMILVKDSEHALTLGSVIGDIESANYMLLALDGIKTRLTYKNWDGVSQSEELAKVLANNLDFQFEIFGKKFRYSY